MPNWLETSASPGRQGARGKQRFRAEVGFRDAELVGNQRVARAPRREHQRAVGLHAGQAPHAPVAQAHLQDVQRDFAVHRPVAGNVTFGGKARMREQARGQGFGGGHALSGAGLAAALAQRAPRFAPGIGAAVPRAGACAQIASSAMSMPAKRP